jgi:hypothetical protein
MLLGDVEQQILFDLEQLASRRRVLLMVDIFVCHRVDDFSVVMDFMGTELLCRHLIATNSRTSPGV